MKIVMEHELFVSFNFAIYSADVENLSTFFKGYFRYDSEMDCLAKFHSLGYCNTVIFVFRLFLVDEIA